MQNIQKELKLARAELAAIEATNKETAIAAAFKRTSQKVSALDRARQQLSRLQKERDAHLELASSLRKMASISQNAERAVRFFDYSNDHKAEALRLTNEDINSAVLECHRLHKLEQPVLQSTEEAEARVEALVAQLPKREWHEYDRQGAMAKAEARIEAGEQKIDLIRSRMAAAKAVVPGEAQEWLPLDGDEAAETLAWLEAKRESARNPRRKGDRRNCLTQLDWAQLDAASSYHWDGSRSFPCGKVGRYWAERHDWWSEGYEARARAAEAAAWER